MIHELFGNPLFQTIAGGVLGGVSANRQNAANLSASREDFANTQATREAAQQALTGTVGDVTTTRRDGGFDVAFTPGSAQEQLVFGDEEFRAPAINDLSASFQRELPTLAHARGVIEKDNILQQGTFDQGLNDLLTVLSRKDRDNNPLLQGDAVGEIGRFADANRFGSERDALNLYNQQGRAETDNLLAAIQANSPQARTLSGPGGQASNLFAQIPTPGATPDVSGVIPFAAGGNIIQQLQAQEGQRAQDEQRHAILRAFLGNQAAKARPEA